MKAELFISWRYLATRRKEKFISLISIISVLGVAIGVAALIVVIAVMTGFDRDLREKIVGNYSHLTVVSYGGGISYPAYEELARKLKNHPHVTGISPYVQGQVLLREGKRFFAVSLKGIDPQQEARVSDIGRYLKGGSLDGLAAGGIVVGKELAMYLGLAVGSKIDVYSGLGKKHTLNVEGIFASGMYDYDMNLVFVETGTAQEILGIGGLYSAVAVKLDDLYLAGRVRQELGPLAGPDYSLKTWMEVNQNFFAALKLEKLTMFIILTLIILVAAFNIASTLIVMVVEKTKDIGILKALGMTQSGIRRVFTLHGLIIGGLGISLGTGSGLALCAALKKYQFIKLPQDIYYIDRLPVQIDIWPDIVLIVVAAAVITLAATFYPAGKAAGLQAAEALRYE